MTISIIKTPNKYSPLPAVTVTDAVTDGPETSRTQRQTSNVQRPPSQNKNNTTNKNTNKNTHNTTSTATRTSNNMMYGDIVIGLWWCIVVPFHARDLWLMEADDPLLAGARLAYFGLVHACGWTLYSIFGSNKKLWVSRMAFLANVFAMSATNLLEFPFPGECAITPMMVGGTVLGVLANISLAFGEKLLRLPVYFAAGSYVCIHSPYCSYEDDTRPILGGTVVLEMILLCVAHLGGIQRLRHQLHKSLEMNVAHLARMVLALLFLHHLTTTLLQLGGDPTHQQHNLQHPPNHHYPTVGLGLHGMDGVWIDAKQHPHPPLTSTVPPPVLHETNATATATRTATTGSTLAEQFFVLVQAAVIAVVGVAATGAFQEEINSKERAERKAKEESMMSKAMADSMMVLTHELRTPLQGIMGATSMLLQTKSSHRRNSNSNGNNNKNEDTDKESLKLIMASSGLLLNLINNMLDVKRVAEGMMEEFPLTLLPASEPIRDAIGFCLPLASISNVKIVVDYGNDCETPSTEHAVVRSNALRLQQVLINLISNAIKYTNADGETESLIKVSLRATTVEDVDWRMKRALASSRPSPTHRFATTAPTNQSKDTATTFDQDSWALKSRDERVLLFGVSDCGPGIDQVQANKLFRRFGRLEDNAPKRTLGANKVGQPSGTGLGLHLCQLFVQRMEGQIWATNNSDGAPGATFFFCLPLGLETPTTLPTPLEQPSSCDVPTTKTTMRSASAAFVPRKSPRPMKPKLGSNKRHWGMRFDRRRSSGNSATGEGKSRSSESNSSSTSPPPSLMDCDNESSLSSSDNGSKMSVFSRRVLLVDDTLINRKILDRMMKQLGFRDTCCVGSGRAALQELYRQRYDLVITDLQMPGMNGMELSEAIRAKSQHDEFFPTPVVVGLTADTCLETVENCKSSGMSDVIHKPITVEELREFFERRISILIDQNQSEYLEP